MAWFDRIGEVFQGVGEVAVGGTKAVGGTAAYMGGATIGLAGFVVEPVVYAGAKAAAGLVEGLDQGNILASEEEYDTFQDETLAWPGWGNTAVSQYGQDVMMAGLTTAGEGAFGHGANAVELWTGTDSNPQNEQEFRATMNAAYGEPSPAVNLGVALLNPSTLGRVINVAGVVWDSTEWLRSRGVEVPPMTRNEYEQLLGSEIISAETSSLQSDVEEAEQSQSISREQAFTYARILAGPDGWSAFGDSNRGIAAIRHAQQGNYPQVMGSWNAWRAKGGTWRNDA